MNCDIIITEIGEGETIFIYFFLQFWLFCRFSFHKTKGVGCCRIATETDVSILEAGSTSRRWCTRVWKGRVTEKIKKNKKLLRKIFFLKFFEGKKERWIQFCICVCLFVCCFVVLLCFAFSCLSGQGEHRSEQAAQHPCSCFFVSSTTWLESSLNRNVWFSGFSCLRVGREKREEEKSKGKKKKKCSRGFGETTTTVFCLATQTLKRKPAEKTESPPPSSSSSPCRASCSPRCSPISSSAARSKPPAKRCSQI